MTIDLWDAPGAAVLSDCGRYRYSLERRWADHPRYVLWLMLNPSTADATKNDATIRRCMRFAKDWGYGGILVANLYAWRATHPTELFQAPDPVGDQGCVDGVPVRNDEFLERLWRRAGTVVCAWGQRGPIAGRRWQVIRLLRASGGLDSIGIARLNYLTLNGNGEPGHPLRLRSELTPQFWDVTREAREGGNGYGG